MAAPMVQDAQQRATALLEEFTTPEGIDAEACAGAALGRPPSEQQVCALDQAVGEVAQVALLTDWLTAEAEAADNSGMVTVHRMGSVVTVADARTGREVLEKLAGEHGVYGVLRYEDGSLVDQGGELKARRLTLEDIPLALDAAQLASGPTCWDAVVSEVANFEPHQMASKIFERVGRRLLKLGVSFKREESDTEAASVSKGLSALIALRELVFDLKGTRVGDDGANAIASGLQALKQLQQITLIFLSTKVGDDGVIAIARGLGVLKQLQQITLKFWSCRNVGDASANAIACALQGLNKLQQITLVFGETNVGDDGAIAIANGLQALKQLQQITLNFWITAVTGEAKNSLREKLSRPGVDLTVR